MLNKEPSPRSTIVILTVIAIAGIALMLSLLSYQFFIIASNKIVDIASHEVRSNVRIEVHDISQILANKLQTVGSLLQTLAESTAIHNNEYKRADIVINTRQQSSSDLTDFYMWLDKNGKINWISNMNESTYQKYKGTDLSHRPYFTIPRDTHRAYYSGLMESNDKVARLYISYPIINTTETGIGTAKGVLTGVVVASIGLNTLGNFLKSQLFPQFNSTIGLLDRNGTILYANGGQQYVGETVFGDKFRSTLSSLHPPESITTPLNNVSSRSFEGKNGSEDILINGQMKTISYHPVALNGKDFLTLYIIIRNAKRLNRLSDEILDVTRLEAQTLELKKEQFNLNDVILHAMNDMMSSRGFSSKNLKLLYEPRDILLKADKSRIAEVISNLLSNAIKFTPEGTITISVEKEEAKNWV